MVNKGNRPQMALIKVSELFLLTQIHFSNGNHVFYFFRIHREHSEEEPVSLNLIEFVC